MDAGDQGHTGGPRRPRLGASAQFRAATEVIERAQDLVTILVGAGLLLLSVVLLGAAVSDFFTSHAGVINRASGFLDQVLLVLILVEIVHTVVLSLRSHTLQPEPFIVVALIASIRKLLFILGGQQTPSTAQFALFISTAAVFVAALVVVRHWSSPNDSGPGITE